ncbi:MAG: gluconate 2-dehydrogenase subunit 3 family protein [Alphaproteobacteria bacterium]|nr:gluconate 2-dehydrogenase subunit 3 family protein [Alphaproteobacteria bacterium]
MARDGMSRRVALRLGAVLSAAALALPRSAFADTIRRRLPWGPAAADRPERIDARPGYLFFTDAEAAFVEAAVARLIPKDELGPGALETGVPRFIDRQLAGPYGQGDHFYLQAPMPKGVATQGWQMGSPSEVYRLLIPQVNRWAADAYGQAFAALGPDKQDEALKVLEKGDASLKGGVDGKAFFELLLQNTIEGFFADPIYGGNRDMAGWRLIGFPGARYDYRDFVGRHGEAYPLPPVSLSGRREWTGKQS